MKNYNIQFIAFSLLIILLSGCGNLVNSYRQNAVDVSFLYSDNAYPTYKQTRIETEQELFALDDEMKNMVKHILKPEKDHERKARLLLNYIFSSNHIAMSYDVGTNVTAIDAFHGSKANCMSLTIMAYALANEAGMRLKFQDIEVPEYWVREGSHQLIMGHVNLLISKPSPLYKGSKWSKEILQIDFDPNAAKDHFPRKTVSKQTMVAMFYNNKGAEALVEANYDRAYAYFKAATEIDPLYSNAWGNLGVLYKVNRNYDLAIRTYQHALSLSPEDLTALENLALLFNTLERKDEASTIANKLHKKRLKNPHYHALLANEAKYKNEYESAIRHLKNAIRLEAKYHEFHFDLAKLYVYTDQIALAKSSMEKAIKYNENINTERQYNRKLNILNQASVRY